MIGPEQKLNIKSTKYFFKEIKLIIWGSTENNTGERFLASEE